MIQCQLDAYAVLVRELPALVEELKTQYEWRPPTSVEGMNELSDIMKM